MSIAAVVTRGYASGGSIALVVTRGYLSGDAIIVPPLSPERQGGASYLTREEYEAALARYREQEQDRKRFKRKAKQRRAQIRRGLEYDPQPEEPDADEEQPQPSGPEPLLRLGGLLPHLFRLQAAIDAAADEDEIESMLMLTDHDETGTEVLDPEEDDAENLAVLAG